MSGNQQYNRDAGWMSSNIRLNATVETSEDGTETIIVDPPAMDMVVNLRDWECMLFIPEEGKEQTNMVLRGRFKKQRGEAKFVEGEGLRLHATLTDQQHGNGEYIKALAVDTFLMINLREWKITAVIPEDGVQTTSVKFVPHNP